MIRTDREGTRMYFVFDHTIANIEELRIGWLNGTGKVSAQTYAFNIKNFKSMCHL